MSKRLFDLVGAGFGLVLLAPLLLGLALWVRLDSPGPILYRQQRVGRNGVPFDILKFRTMRADVGGPQLTVGRDVRVTRAGHWLRRRKLDELPQLVNVLHGSMSLVGPRPEVPRYVACYPADVRAALAWIALYSVALAVVAASKIAFLGWHTGVHALRFHALSGHATGFTAVFPTACGLLGQRYGRTASRVATGLALGVGALVVVALVKAQQHTPAEAVAGWALGTVTCLLGLRLGRSPAAAPASPTVNGLPPAALMAALVAATVTAWTVQLLPFGYWMIRAALVLSGRTYPFSWDRC